MKTAEQKVDTRTLMKINYAGEQIDQMVYELYGMSEEEVGIVEEC